MADPFSTTDIVLAVVGVFLVILQVLIWLVNRNLPSVKLRNLENTLDETEALLKTCMEEGRFLDPSNTVEFERQLQPLRARATDLRVAISGAKTYMDEIKYMCNGLSHECQDTCEEVKEVRANISVRRLIPGLPDCVTHVYPRVAAPNGMPTYREDDHHCAVRLQTLLVVRASSSTSNTWRCRLIIIHILAMVPFPSPQYRPSNLAISEPRTAATISQGGRRGAGGVSVTNTELEGTSPRVKHSRFTRFVGWFTTALLATPHFRSMGSPPEPACDPSGLSDPGISMQPLLHSHQPEPSRHKSVSSKKLMGTPSVRRKKQMNALGRARARAHILRRAYV
ncbi:hypothetical protein BD413DRAFT_165351 [Trametes elegans]|nr:hypothetical protein BD413DRAFT_165351 [Trametes elegans]